MKITLVLFIAVFGLVHCGSVKQIKKRYDNHEQLEVLGHVDASDYHHGLRQHDDNDHGFSAGSGLRSIAQGSANRAHSAVANQHAAAQQAAYVAKSTLAQSAIQAAATANAALAGKEVLLRGLDKQASEAHQAVEGEIAQLQLAKAAAAAAKQSAEAAGHHVSVLTAALNNAQASAAHAEEAANAAAAELASQTSMVGKAKGRFETTANKLHAAQIDFEATKEAAGHASAAAHEAQENASNAGAYASHKLNEAALAGSAEVHHDNLAEAQIQFRNQGSDSHQHFFGTALHQRH